MAEVQYDDGSGWTTINRANWRVENGVSSKLPAPRAVIETDARTSIAANTDIRIVEGSDTIFEGFARTGGEFGQGGSQRIECRGDAWRILDEEVTLDLASTTDEQVISAALADTERGGDFSLSYPETAIDVGDYEADGRQFQIVLRDMMDRSGRVWWFDSAAKTLHIQSLGYRGEWAQLETERDGISVQTWNEGDIATVQNEVRVKGTGSDPVSATREDTTSISDYGRHSKTYSYRWITDAAQAGDLAEALLIPDPLQSGKVLVSERAVGSNTWENLANYSITLTDDARGIGSVIAGIEKQVIQEGRTTLHVGKGSGYAESKINRDTQSAQDAVRQNYTQLEGTLDDIDDGTEFGKILDDAIDSGYHTLNKAVGNLDDIVDGTTYGRIKTLALDSGVPLLEENIGDIDDIQDGTTYAKVNTGNVDSSGYVLLASSVGDLSDVDGDLDDIPDGTNFGRVNTVALDSNKILLEEAIGDLDNIDDGTDFAKVSSTDISAGSILLSTTVGDLDDIDDGTNYGKVSSTDISAGSILLSESVGDLDDISDGGTYERVKATSLDAGEVTLSKANGDLDDIQDGTSYGKVDITHLTSGGAVFATGVELDDGRSLDDITTEDASKADATVIDGGDILTSSLTAEEIQTLYLDTGTLRIGTDTSDEFRFSIDSGTNSPRMNTTTDGTGVIGDLDSRLAAMYTQIIDTGAFTAGETYTIVDNLQVDQVSTELRVTDADYDMTIGENPMTGKTGPALYPSSDSRAEVGTGDGTNSDKAIGSVHTINLYEYTPAPLSPDDPRIQTPTDGGHPVDLDELKGSTWMDPPEYAAQGQDPETGEYRKNPEREDGTRGVEMGHMLNYVFEVTKRLAEERDALADRVDDLEARLNRVEDQLE